MMGLKTELLVQMDGVGNDNEGVLLLGATNLPWTLDPAVQRRFQRKIHIPLPDEKARRQLFKISAEKMEVPLGKADYIELASMTDGFSGSDISNALQDALDVPVKTVQNASFYRKVQDEGKELFTPCEESNGGAIKMTFIDVPRGKLKAPVVRREDIFAVLRDVKASVSQEEIKKCMEWTEQFGSEGA
ncbi:hypothetical protein DL771_006586 [Monosporascus sp. 5C6A]|nr:hypothetical protein DL771_006586 [Monosporascus sp. 5C6A]